MTDARTLLGELGFGEYEARAYLALLGREPLNGYELAKLSGVPRANVYSVLQKLEERGAVVHVDMPASTRYAAIPISELLGTLERRYKATLTAAATELKQVSIPPQADNVWNLEGYELLLDHARSVLVQTRERVLLATWPQEARALAAELDAAAERGVDIGTLCLAGCPQECGACRGSIHRQRLSDQTDMRALVIVADDGIDASGNATGNVIAAEITPGGADAVSVRTARGIRTRQRQLIELAASYVRHSIALAAVLADLGPRIVELVAPETRRALSLLARSSGHAAWLAGLRQLLSGNAEEDPTTASSEPRAEDQELRVEE